MENGVLIGVASFVLGLAIAVTQLVMWANESFGVLDPVETMRFTVPAALFMILGAQTIMSGMFVGILTVDIKK